MQELLAELFTHIQGMWRYRWYALLVVWLVSLAGWAWVYTLPDEYESNARIFVNTQSILKPLLRGLSVDTNVYSRMSAMTRTLLSRPNLENVARETDMDLRAQTPEAMGALVAQLQRKVTISSAPHRNDLYTIAFTDRDPVLDSY